MGIARHLQRNFLLRSMMRTNMFHGICWLPDLSSWQGRPPTGLHHYEPRWNLTTAGAILQPPSEKETGSSADQGQILGTDSQVWYQKFFNCCRILAVRWTPKIKAILYEVWGEMSSEVYLPFKVAFSMQRPKLNTVSLFKEKSRFLVINICSS